MGRWFFLLSEPSKNLAAVGGAPIAFADFLVCFHNIVSAVPMLSPHFSMFAPAHRAPAEVQVFVDSVLLDLSSSFYLTYSP